MCTNLFTVIDLYTSYVYLYTFQLAAGAPPLETSMRIIVLVINNIDIGIITTIISIVSSNINIIGSISIIIGFSGMHRHWRRACLSWRRTA